MRGLVSGRATSADGVAVHFEVAGTGEPALVFVHGWSCDLRYWAPQVEHFARHHQVVAVDLAGHGESGSGRADWTMPAFGMDVVAVADQLGLGEMVLVGHSMGGDVIVEAARHLSDRVVGLVWLDTYRSLGEPLSEAEVESFVAPFRADFAPAVRHFVRDMFLPTSDPDLAEWVAADMAAAPVDVALPALRHAITFEPALVRSLRELTIPHVAINPDDRPSDVEGLARYGVRTVLMSGVGHFLMMEDPDTFNRLLAATVEDLLR